MKKSLALAIGTLAIASIVGCSASPPQSSDDPVTITWASWNPGKDNAEALIKQFEATHPDIHVEFQFSEYSNYQDVLRPALASGSGPDVWFASAGAFATQYAELAEDLAPYAVKEWGDDWRSNFYDIGLKQVDVDGRTVSLPWMLLAAGYIWYNQNQFEAAGINEPPATLDELFADADKLRAAGFEPFAQGAQDNWINFETYMNIANQTAPGAIEEAQVGDAKWTDPGLVEAMDIWGSLFTEGLMQPGALAAVQYPDVADAFFGGKTAMFSGGTWDNNNALSAEGVAANVEQHGLEPDTIFRPFLFPDVNGDGEPATATGGPDTVIMMNTAGAHKDATWTFIAWLLGPEGQKSRTDILIPPALKGYDMDTSNLQDPALQGPDLEAQLTAVENAKYARDLTSADIQQALGAALQAVASGQQSSADAMASVQAVQDGLLG